MNNRDHVPIIFLLLNKQCSNLFIFSFVLTSLSEVDKRESYMPSCSKKNVLKKKGEEKKKGAEKKNIASKDQ